MLSDLSTVEPGATLEADLCIVGGGAAGIAIAQEFISSTSRVILLESGGHRRETETQRLYDGLNVGQRYYGLDQCRSRFFGGSTNCWGGICTPLNEIDFETRSWVAWSGWPLDSTELAPSLTRAHNICGSGPFLYGAGAWDRIGLPWREFDADSFEPFVWHFNTRSTQDISFGRRFRHELTRAPNIHVFLHANVTALLTGENGGAVERVRVATLDGRIRYVRARAFVLACGGIENARILLASNDVHPHGVGNRHDLVGRFFHEHLEVPCGILDAADRSKAIRYSELAPLGETGCLPGLALSRQAQTRFRTLNGSISLDPLYDPEGGLTACWDIRKDLRARRIQSSMLGRRIWRVARDTHNILPEVWRRAFQGARPRGIADRFLVFARAEQAPNPASRVTLTSDTDQLGMPRACLDWRTTEFDRASIRLMATLAADEFERLGFGKVTRAAWLESGEWPPEMLGGPHHMGTTRMSDDPRTGVVDRHCQVRDVEKLFVAGSSVFPTGGHANPTLTIVALAVRLAAHIRDKLSREYGAAVRVSASPREICSP